MIGGQRWSSTDGPLGSQLSRRHFLQLSANLFAVAFVCTRFSMSKEPDKIDFEIATVILEEAEHEIEQARIVSAKNTLASASAEAMLLAFGDNDVLQRRYLLALAISFRDVGDTDKAIGAFDQLQVLSRNARDHLLYGRAVIGKVICLSNAGRKTLAKAVLDLYGQDLASIRDPQFTVEYLFWKSRVLTDTNEIESARRIYAHQVLPLSAQYEDDNLQIARLSHFSRLALSGNTRDWKSAESSFEKARDLLSSTTNIQRRAQFETTQAFLCLQSGDREGAKRALARARQLYHVSGIDSPTFRAVEAAIEQEHG